MAYFIGMDIGTSATKVALFDANCHGIATATESYAMQQPQNGWAEEKPTAWRQAVTKGIRMVLAESNLQGKDIAAIGLSGQMHGLVLMDDKGEVLRPAILWCDQRTGKECKEITQIVGEKRLLQITANPALTGFTASKIRWVQKHEPEVWQCTQHILLPKDYVRWCMTGDFATDVSDASGMQLLDVPRRCWSSEIAQALDIPLTMLPQVYESPEITGYISPAFAQATGLLAGTPVVAGAGDNAGAAIGTGIVEDGQAFVTVGTSGVVFAHTDKLSSDPKGRAHAFCAAVPYTWHVMGVTQAAGLSLTWFLQNFAQDWVTEAKAQKQSLYELLQDKVVAVPRGSRRLFYLPYLMGERTPHLDPDARGVFFGLSAMHGKAECARAVMEGVGYSLLDCQEVLTSMGVKIATLMICGGGAKSPTWRSIIADMMGTPVHTLVTEEGPALGAALLAAVGVGAFADVRQAAKRAVKIAGETLPDAKGTAFYRQGHGLYRKLYASLREDFQALAKL